MKENIKKYIYNIFRTNLIKLSYLHFAVFLVRFSSSCRINTKIIKELHLHKSN